MALEAEFVHLPAGDRPLVGDQLGRLTLCDQAAPARVSSAHRRAERESVLSIDHRRPHRNPRHQLDAGRDRDVIGAGDHPLRGEVDRLLARPALAVDRRAGDLLRPAGGEHGVTPDVDALLADLHHAPHDDVVDVGRIDSGPIDDRVERRGGQVDRVMVREHAIALSERRPHGADDDGARTLPTSHDPCEVPGAMLGAASLTTRRSGAEIGRTNDQRPSIGPSICRSIGVSVNRIIAERPVASSGAGS